MARPAARRCVDLEILGNNVGIKANRNRFGFEQDRLRPLELLFHGVDVVDNYAAVGQLRLQLRHDVHPVDRDVLQRPQADRHRRVQRDQVDRRDVVELGVGHAAAAELGRGAGRGHAARHPAGGQVMAERHEPGDVLAHGQHPGYAVAGF